MTVLTMIDPNSNHCKVYHIDGGSSLYGRIGCTMRSGVVKADTERKKIAKGYVRTVLVQLPKDWVAYNKIRMLRWNAQKQMWVAYGSCRGFYRPMGFEFTPQQTEQFAQYQIPFQRWNDLTPKW